MEQINMHGQVVQSWTFAQIISWDVNWRLFQIQIKIEANNEDLSNGDNVPKALKTYILAGSKKICQSIHEYIGGYIYVSLRFCTDVKTRNEKSSEGVTSAGFIDDNLFLQLTRGGF
ncbi:hypothetical protein ACOME3_009139 [Neoechinorhynchus agilis]